jgi:hypothetical protein
MSTTQTLDTSAETPAPPPVDVPSAAVTDRVKNGLVVVRRRLDAAEARIVSVPAQIRESLDKLVRSARERVRSSLNLPSQAEIEALIARVEELDRKLAALTAQPAPAEAAPTSEPDKKKKKNGK